MSGDLPPVDPPYVEIEGHQESAGRWTFIVSYVMESGQSRPVWLGSNYESAMVNAELLAREGQQTEATRLYIRDRVLPA